MSRGLRLHLRQDATRSAYLSEWSERVVVHTQHVARPRKKIQIPVDGVWGAHYVGLWHYIAVLYVLSFQLRSPHQFPPDIIFMINPRTKK